MGLIFPKRDRDVVRDLVRDFFEIDGEREDDTAVFSLMSREIVPHFERNFPVILRHLYGKLATLYYTPVYK